MTIVGWLAFLAAAGLGATARYLLSLAVQRRAGHRLPVGTFVVNVGGSLVAGGVAAAAVHHGLDPQLQRVVAVAFVGSFTTFSTLTYETVRLAEEGMVRTAVINLVGSTVAGVGAAVAGFALVASW